MSLKSAIPAQNESRSSVIFFVSIDFFRLKNPAYNFRNKLKYYAKISFIESCPDQPNARFQVRLSQFRINTWLHRRRRSSPATWRPSPTTRAATKLSPSSSRTSEKVWGEPGCEPRPGQHGRNDPVCSQVTCATLTQKTPITNFLK